MCVDFLAHGDEKSLLEFQLIFNVYNNVKKYICALVASIKPKIFEKASLLTTPTLLADLYNIQHT
jgi:hypothetical protein